MVGNGTGSGVILDGRAPDQSALERSHPAGTAGSVLKAGLAKRQVTVVPPIERGARNTQLVQRAADRQVGAFNQPEDLQLL